MPTTAKQKSSQQIADLSVDASTDAINDANASISADMTENATVDPNIESKTHRQSSTIESSDPSADSALWELDFFTMKGRKAENQDSLLITTCLLPHSLSITSTEPNPSNKSNSLKKTETFPAPLLVLMADGVSACQFPKQASQLVISTVAEKITFALSKLARIQQKSQDQSQTMVVGLDDDDIAKIIRLAINKANDVLYFPQAYQRVPPLLSTLSGLLCIGDRIHLFHTGDSRIYRVGVDSLTVLSEDHRIRRGEDKGALSAAIGADSQVDLQQSVFTLHQNECLAIMTDGIYEHIDEVELAFELCTAATNMCQALATTHKLPIGFHASQTVCEQAFADGSHDNLSMIMLGMNAMPKLSNSIKNPNAHSENGGDSTHDIHRYQLPTDLEVGDCIDGFTVMSIIARTARSHVYRVQDEDHNDFVLKSPSLDTIADGHYLRDFLQERKIGLSLSKHRRAGESAYNQSDPNRLPVTDSNKNSDRNMGSGLNASGLLRYYPVPASTTYLYHLTEYIEGESLRDFIERHAPCDVWQTYDLLTKIGMATRVMHRNYLLHQDIKPENVLLTKSGAVKLIDFGSASSSILKDSTRPPNGDLHYAAPEYYTDAPKGVHSDLFSIAVIGYELLTGQLPFGSQDLMNSQHTLVMPAQPLRQQNIPPVSQQALMRALHPNINVRYQAIGEFLQDFNPDNSARSRDPEPLIKSNPLLVWHGICFIQTVIIVLLLWVYLS
ncbi:bifunctional serine/threonine-protein phosphatase/kinase [Psychrobacter immobilis]|uniref:bifunctional serine/threonine-protein phosphatase/kinase n=1 Tax=Psychrobacter immobilis TaxID=498 RepID=UPI002A0A927E|nr:bifunctional serine/threonine-protein phosphatase/kinase [Psychrobacter immobilis]